jgi:hypothetical protein
MTFQHMTFKQIKFQKMTFQRVTLSFDISINDISTTEFFYFTDFETLHALF